jgi:hypothetical protein
MFVYVLNQGPWIKVDASSFLDAASRILDARSWVQDSGSRILGTGSKILGPETRILHPGSSMLHPGLRMFLYFAFFLFVSPSVALTRLGVYCLGVYSLGFYWQLGVHRVSDMSKF